MCLEAKTSCRVNQSWLACDLHLELDVSLLQVRYICTLRTVLTTLHTWLVFVDTNTHWWQHFGQVNTVSSFWSSPHHITYEADMSLPTWLRGYLYDEIYYDAFHVVFYLVLLYLYCKQASGSCMRRVEKPWNTARFAELFFDLCLYIIRCVIPFKTTAWSTFSMVCQMQKFWCFHQLNIRIVRQPLICV